MSTDRKTGAIRRTQLSYTFRDDTSPQNLRQTLPVTHGKHTSRSATAVTAVTARKKCVTAGIESKRLRIKLQKYVSPLVALCFCFLHLGDVVFDYPYMVSDLLIVL